MKKKISILKSKISNNSKVAENYLLMTFLASSNMIIGLILYPYLIRVLGTEKYGIYIFILSNIQLIKIFISFGFELPALKKISLFPDDRDIKSQIVSEVISAKMLLWIFNLVLLYILSLYIPFIKNNLIYYYLMLCMQIVDIVFPIWYFQGIQNMRFVTFTNTAIGLLKIPLIFIFVKTSNDFYKYFVILSLLPVLGAISALCYLIINEQLEIRFASIKSIKKLFVEALPFFWANALNVIKLESVPFILGTFFGHSSVAVYDLANKINSIIRLITSNINTAFFPNIIQNRNPERVKKIIHYETYIALVFILVIIIFGYWIVLLLGGKNMVGAYPLAIILSITIYNSFIVVCYTDFIFIPQNRYHFIANSQIVTTFSFVFFATLSLIFFKNMVLIVSLYALSHIIEIFYCRYLIVKHNLI